jgi:hypothetical protein
MAASRSSNTISQRIAIEGDDDIKKRLKDIGDAGEKEFKRIENAVDAGANSSLARLSSIISGAGNSFRAIGASLKPVAEQLSSVREHAAQFGEQMNRFAESIIPHFKEAFALGTAASIAGLVELAKSAGETAHQVEKGAEQFGLGVEAYQALSAAARQAGIEQDTFARIFGRLSRSIGQAAEEIKTQVLTLGAEASKGVTANGVEILNAHAKTTSRLIGDIKQTFAAIEPLAQRLLKEEQQLAASGMIPASAVQSIQAIRQQWIAFANESDANREKLGKLLGNALPPTTMTDALLRAKDAGKDLSLRLQQLGVEAVDLATGKVRPLEETLVEFASKLQQIRDPAVRAFEAQQILGKQWQALVPILNSGGKELEELTTKFVQLGVAFDLASTKLGVELFQSFERLSISLSGIKNLIGLAFAPVLIPLIDAITEAISSQVPMIKAWAASIADAVKPAVEDLIALLRGAAAETMKSDFVKSLVYWRDQLLGLWPTVKVAFGAILSAADGVAAALNAVFGTEFSGLGLIVVAVVGQMVGLFGLLSSAITLVGSVAGVLLALPWAAVFTGVSAALTAAVPLFEGMLAALIGIAGAINWPLVLAAGIGAIIAALATWNVTWEQVTAAIGSGVTMVLGWFDAVLAKIGAMIDALARFLGMGGGGASPMATAPIPPASGYAEGGLVHGPGTGTSDSVPLWGSDGEFMVNALATRAFLPLLQWINGQKNPMAGLAMPRAMGIQRFAAGGLITAAATTSGGTPVHLHLDGQTYSLTGPQRTVSDLQTAARSAQLLSTGRKPGWVGG